MKPAQLFEVVIRSIPYPSQITNIAIEENAIRLTWRGHRFRVSTKGHVETVGSGVLIGDNMAILLQSVIADEFHLFKQPEGEL